MSLESSSTYGQGTDIDKIIVHEVQDNETVDNAVKNASEEIILAQRYVRQWIVSDSYSHNVTVNMKV
jgi:hypothetical protein